MTRYQGKALERGPVARGKNPRQTGLPVQKSLRILAVMVGLIALAMVPWAALRKKLLVIDRIQVTGLRYLDASKVSKRSGLATGQDLLDLDVTRARQMLLLEPRIASARVRRSGLRGVGIQIVERVPMLAVDHGEPWEIDAEGVLLEPLQAGVVADVPLLAGPDFSNRRPGSLIQTPEVRRGLAWTAILSDNALRLAGQVSEVDVSDARITRLVLLNGVRVVAPAWPNGARQLSGLRATLADLSAKGMTPREVDVRFKDQIVVRGAKPDHPIATTTTSRES